MIDWWWLLVQYFAVGAVISYNGRTNNGDGIYVCCQVFVFWFLLIVVKTFWLRR